MSDVAKVIRDKINSGTSILWLYTNNEEERLEKILISLCGSGENCIRQNYKFWDSVSGYTDFPTEITIAQINPLQSLMQIRAFTNTIVIARDLHTILLVPQNVPIRRTLLQLCRDGGINDIQHKNVLAIISNSPNPPNELRDYCDIIDLPLPDVQGMRHVVEEAWLSFVESLRNAYKQRGKDFVEPKLDEELAYNLSYALCGMSHAEALRVLLYAVYVNNGFTNNILNTVMEEKSSVIRKIEGLTFVPNKAIVSSEDIGGYSAFKLFLKQRALAYTRHAQQLGLERPRGVVLLGCPGTGKTMVAKAAAKILGLDLVVMDMTAMLDSYVGSSEKKQRAALATVSAMKNCVLVVDEIDKIFSGTHMSNTDSGVSSHLLSSFLSWLADRDMVAESGNRVFVIVTANRVDMLPPEMLRPGRFDRIFGVGLPSALERAEILSIHMRKRGIPPENYNMDKFVAETSDFSGAELEEAVITARFMQYEHDMTTAPSIYEKQQVILPEEKLFLDAIHGIKPLAHIAKDDVMAMRDFCARYTTPVSLPSEKKSRKNIDVVASTN